MVMRVMEKHIYSIDLASLIFIINIAVSLMKWTCFLKRAIEYFRYQCLISLQIVTRKKILHLLQKM